MKAIQKKLCTKGMILQITSFAVLASCQKEDAVLNSIDVQNVNSEAASSAMLEENLEITTRLFGALTTSQYAGSRVETDISALSSIENRVVCASVTLQSSGTKSSPAGTITVDYGNGTLSGAACMDARGVQRIGKILIMYTGQRWSVGSTFTIQFNNYYRNGTLIEGTEYDTIQTSVDSLHLQFKSHLSGGVITFTDGQYILREDSLVKVWYRFINPATGLVNATSDEWHVTGDAGGKNTVTQTKTGETFTVQINDPLIYRVLCLASGVMIPVSGTKKITVGTNYNINYGNSTCDNVITVTLNNGKQQTITVSNDGN